MKIQRIIWIILIFILQFLIFNLTNAAINLDVSPIKEEINANPGETITRIAKVRNRTDWPLHLTTWKSDFIANWATWKPDFIRKSELVYPDQQLSDWITISTWAVDLEPWEQKEIEYYIHVPESGTPGWHYGAIFFKNNNSEVSWWWWTQVPINVDYWVLILVNVSWEINTEAEIQEPIIYWSSDWWWWANLKDKCPFWDLSKSYYDGICIDNTEDIIKEIKWEETSTSNSTWEIEENKDFNITFEIPIKNIWNTHIKPSWKIILVDEDWNEIKEVWKEYVTNDKWAITSEKIVDYIPINDIWWNILPYTERNYQSEWKGFPFKTYDETWKEIIDYWDPSEYYTKKNVEDRWFLMFWERVCETKQHKKITAIFDISYNDENGELVEFNSAKDFYIDYTEQYIGLNPYVLIPLWSIIWIIIIFWLVWIARRKKCPNCKKRVDRDMKICPYCWEKLQKRKYTKRKTTQTKKVNNKKTIKKKTK